MRPPLPPPSSATASPLAPKPAAASAPSAARAPSAPRAIAARSAASADDTASTAAANEGAESAASRGAAVESVVRTLSRLTRRMAACPAVRGAVAAAALLAAGLTLSAAEEKAHPFYQAVPDPLRGDWAASGGGYVAQVIRASDRAYCVNDLPPPVDDGRYVANVFHAFDVPHDTPVAVLSGVRTADGVDFSGGGWTGSIRGGRFKASREGESFDLVHVERTPPTLGEKPPAGAVVLFDGTNMDAWAKKQGKEWLKEDGPSRWKLVDGVMEVVPGADCIITHRKFGDFVLHVEFRTLGGTTNSGVYLMDRYESNINEMYGMLTGNACAQFDNCTPKSAIPGIRCSRPPLVWQTLDIEFHAPRFDAAGTKVAKARATIRFNGTLFYKDQPLDRPGLSAARLGEAPTGPLMLQEHGMPCQFRNIWLVETPAS